MGKTEVTPSGTASEIHHASIQAPALKTGTAASDNPAPLAMSHTATARAGPNNKRIH